MSLNIVEAALASKLKGDQGQQLPEVTSDDNGKALVVQNGEWTAAEVPSASLGMLDATRNSTYYASDDGYDGYSEVAVNVTPVLVPLEATQNTTYFPSEYQADGFSSVDVSVDPANLGTLTATENITYYALDAGYDGYSEVTVNVPTESNPNTSFVFTGTVDDPTSGAVQDYSDVIEGIYVGNMTAVMEVGANSTLGTPDLKLTSVVYSISKMSLMTGALDSSISNCNVAQIVYDANGILSVVAIQNGTVLDLTAYAPMLTCTLYVLVHPMPD